MNAETYIKFVLALAVVLALIAVVAWLARRFGFGLATPTMPRSKRRLGVVESAALDTKRRLVLVHRDDVGHLLLLGPGSETVIEAGIPLPDRADGAAAPDAAADGAAPERSS